MEIKEEYPMDLLMKYFLKILPFSFIKNLNLRYFDKYIITLNYLI